MRSIWDNTTRPVSPSLVGKGDLVTYGQRTILVHRVRHQIGAVELYAQDGTCVTVYTGDTVEVAYR